MPESTHAPPADVAQPDPLEDVCGGDLSKFLKLMVDKNAALARTGLVLTLV